jgi:hypothetical protein
MGSFSLVGLRAGGRHSTDRNGWGGQSHTTYLLLQMSRSKSTTRPVMSVRQIQTMVRVS